MLRYRLRSVTQPVNQSFCGRIWGFRKRRRKVVPETLHPLGSEMINVQKKRNIHVIHICPAKKRLPKRTIAEEPTFSYKPLDPYGVLPNANGTGSCVIKAEVHSESTIVHSNIDTNLKNCICENSDESDTEGLSELSKRPMYSFECSFPFSHKIAHNNFLFEKVALYVDQIVSIALEDALNDLNVLQKLMFPENEKKEEKSILDEISKENCKYTHEIYPSSRVKEKALPLYHKNSFDNGYINPFFHDSNPELNVVGNSHNRPWEKCSFSGCQCLYSGDNLSSTSLCFRESELENSVNLNGGIESSYNEVFDASILNCSEVYEMGNRVRCQTSSEESSSRKGSSIQNSTWGSSTDGSLRYVRRFFSKRCKIKPLLFFIHGVGTSSEVWKSQLNFFHEKGYEIVAIDLMGHGLSSAPNDPKAYTFHSILADVLILFDKYGKERNVVVSHAYGCSFAAALARQRPRQVTQLALLSGGGPLPLGHMSTAAGFPVCCLSCIGLFMKCGFKREAFYMPSGKQMKSIEGLHIPSYVLQHIAKGQIWPEGDIAFHKQISIPTLLIYGLKDPFVTLVEECEMERTIPRAFLELIPEASHMLMLESPDKVNDMIYKFLRRWGR